MMHIHLLSYLSVYMLSTILVTLIRKYYYWTVAHMTVHRLSLVVYIGACISKSTLTQILL